MMTVIKPGSRIELGGGLTATVLAVLVRGLEVQYEVSWIVNGDRKTAWIEDHEITSSRNSSTMELGFK